MSYYGQASGCLSSQTLADSDPRHLHSVNINANAANPALSGAQHKLNVLLSNRQEEEKVTDISSCSPSAFPFLVLMERKGKKCVYEND